MMIGTREEICFGDGGSQRLSLREECDIYTIHQGK